MDNDPHKRAREREKNNHSLGFYLKEIAETPLLKAGEEVALAKRAKEGDQKALDRLAKANLRFVVSVAKQYQNQGLSLPDLINEGNIGVIKAAKRFDETRGFKFISYAVWWIRRAILQALAEQSRIVRLPLKHVGALYKIRKVSSRLEQEQGWEPSPDDIAKALEMSEGEVSDTMSVSNTHLSLDAPFSGSEDNSLIDVLEDKAAESPDQALSRDDLILAVRKALATLSPREAEVISLYFGIDVSKSLNLEEIGIRFNLTRERVRQIKEVALRHLRHSSRSRTLKSFIGE